MTTKNAGAMIARALVIVGTLQVPQLVRAESASTVQIREAANKATRLMEASMVKVNANAPCVSCHHGMMPLWTLAIARDHGLTVNATTQKQAAIRSFSALKDVDSAIQGTHVVDENLDVGELLAFGPELGVAPSVTAALHARHLANYQQADGHWKTMDARPPQSYSHFMVTAVAGKAVAAYLPDSDEAKANRLGKARAWLASNQPVSTEDATFRVLGLAWLGGTAEQLSAAAKDLAKRQNTDGGWSSMPGRESDAYASGEALFALKRVGRADEKAFVAGVRYLLRTQAADGSWHVKTRIHEVAHVSPPKMDTGFPYGPDQIVSMYATTWAVAALSLGLPEQKTPVEEMTQVRPDAPSWVEAVAFGTTAQLDSVEPNAKTAKGSTALMVAASDPARAARLIERGADPKFTAQSGQTALSVAASYAGTGPLVKQLLKLGVPAKLDQKAEFHANPLIETAWTGDVEVAKALLDAGADMKAPMLRLGVIPMTPLKAAVALDSAEILREYLRRGADPNTIDEIPLLSWAAIGNRLEAAKALLEAGANPQLKDQYGWTPLMHSQGVDHDVNPTEKLIRATAGTLQAIR